MIIDRGHRAWIAATAIALAAASLLYAIYVRALPEGPSGGSRPGLAFGIAGTALMLMCGLLSARKNVPTWPLGTAGTWLKGHIWLGLLSVPLILFHTGFRMGGLLEQGLMWVYAIIIVSGCVGLALQYFLPRMIKTAIPAEAMYNQTQHVLQRLCATADSEVQTGCAARDRKLDHEEELHRESLQRFYLSTVRPFLAGETSPSSLLSNAEGATALFTQVRESLPPSFGQIIVRLEMICDERRQLGIQHRFRGWLHAWLLIHVPLSVTLLVLVAAHIVMSLYY